MCKRWIMIILILLMYALWDGHNTINKREITKLPHTAEEDDEIMPETEWIQEMDKQPDKISESFLVQDTDIMVSLEECNCEYDRDGIRIYAKNVNYEIGYVIYIQTPSDTMQLFPDNYIIDSENGVVYVLYRNKEGSFENSIFKYFIEEASNNISVSTCKVITANGMEEWLSGSYQLSLDSDMKNFINFQVILKDLEYEQKNVILKGDASGEYKATGEKYYIDWKLNCTTYEMEVFPCILKIYDADNDRKDLESCNEAFNLIEQGDWSLLIPFEGIEYFTGKNEYKWQRMDVNGDGMPELLDLYSWGTVENSIIPIERIFAYNDGYVELIYSDLNDYTEYLFPSENGNLIYDYSDHGVIQYGSYTRYQFDVKWNLKKLDHVEIYYFCEEDDYDQEEIERLKEHYPETYGTYGSGFYFYRSRPKTLEELIDNTDGKYWVREVMTEEQFLNAYQEMTGLDFFVENTDFAVWKEIN